MNQLLLGQGCKKYILRDYLSSANCVLLATGRTPLGSWLWPAFADNPVGCGLLRVTTCARVSQTGRRRWTEDWKAINVGGSSDHVLAHARADEAGDATKGENPWEIFDPATRAIPGV
jgi:hypothetical protein